MSESRAGFRSSIQRVCIVAIAAVIATVPSPVCAQQRPNRLLGVFDDATSQPVAGAEVIDVATGTKAITSETGTVTLAFLELGTTVVKVRKVGYAERMFPVVVTADDTTSFTIILKPLGQALPTVVTTGTAIAIGKMAEFERRRATGFGHFLAQDQIERHADGRMSDVMQLLAGVKIKYVSVGEKGKPLPGAYIVSTRGAQSLDNHNTTFGMDCPAAVMLDGSFVYQGIGGEFPFDINSLSPGDIAGIEYYSGGATIPPELNGTRNACGLVVIWTKIKK